MNTNEEMRMRYSRLSVRLSVLGKRIDSLKANIASLERTLKDNVQQDDRVAGCDTIEGINRDLDYIRASLKNSLIPHVKRKIIENN